MTSQGTTPSPALLPNIQEAVQSFTGQLSEHLGVAFLVEQELDQGGCHFDNQRGTASA